MNRALRDLQWAITSPSLVSDDRPIASALQTAIEVFDISSIDQAALDAFLSVAPTRRVGRYFERLVLYWLSRVCGFQIVAHGYQVRDRERTIGELDFLFRDSSGQLHHWETAVKFYLSLSDPGIDGDRLIGPNPADSLEKKLARIYQHQLPLSKRIFAEPVCRHAFVKGRIFYPPPQISAKHLGGLAARLAPAHLRGVWIRARQLDWFAQQDSSLLYRLLNKPHWLAAERVAAGSPESLTATAMQALLEAHFRKAAQPRLCSVLAPRGDHEAEIERLFVVSDDWPAGPAGSKKAEQDK